MKTQELIDLLLNCNPESEVSFMMYVERCDDSVELSISHIVVYDDGSLRIDFDPIVK